MNGALDLATKVIGVLTAILGAAGYVLILGGAIVWLRLSQAGLPTEMPVSLAAREEMIVIGAQAVSVWLVLLAALGGLVAWIVTGAPERRTFGVPEAGFALAVTVAVSFAREGGEWWAIVLPALGGLIILRGAVWFSPSLESMAAALLPAAVGVVVAITLPYLSHGDNIATGVSSALVFAALLLLTPALQRWRNRQERNRDGIDQIRVLRLGSEARSERLDRLALALGEGPRRNSTALIWIGRVAAGSLALLALGGMAIASQVDRNEDFHEALVSLTNGDCLVGTYITHGGGQIVLAQPESVAGEATARVASIPEKEILDLQVYSAAVEGAALDRDAACAGREDSSLVRAAPEESQPPK